MKTNCCMCGVELPITDAIESEIERKQMEVELDIKVPTIGVLCKPCQIETELILSVKL